MALVSLTLSRFRNHRQSHIADAGRFNILVGDNGAGKTNILEALSLLAPGRGMRRVVLSEMAMQDGDGGFAISAALQPGLDDSGEAIPLGTGVNKDAPNRRLVRINKANASAQALAEWLAIIWLTPAMDRLFIDSAGGRRRFLDRLVLALEPGHAIHATRYEAAMRQRNRLLTGDDRPDPAWLNALEIRMAEHGAALQLARARMIEMLEARLDQAETGIFAKPRLMLQSAQLGAVQDTGQMLDEWRKDRGRDAAAGRTLTGPHRDDLLVTMRQKGQAAALCSTGEQKAMLIAIILTHSDLVAQNGTRALLLLLDEVAAHLDPSRRAALYEQLADRCAQVWMTGTDKALFDTVPRSGRRDFYVENGAVI
jgi:DNA replication and repair protein RecF